MLFNIYYVINFDATFESIIKGKHMKKTAEVKKHWK